MNTVRWNVAVSADTDQSLRLFLASQGGGRKGNISRFIEDAVRAHILELTAEQIKAVNSIIYKADLTAIVDQAIQWARKRCADVRCADLVAFLSVVQTLHPSKSR